MVTPSDRLEKIDEPDAELEEAKEAGRPANAGKKKRRKG